MHSQPAVGALCLRGPPESALPWVDSLTGQVQMYHMPCCMLGCSGVQALERSRQTPLLLRFLQWRAATVVYRFQ